MAAGYAAAGWRLWPPAGGYCRRLETMSTGRGFRAACSALPKILVETVFLPQARFKPTTEGGAAAGVPCSRLLAASRRLESASRRLEDTHSFFKNTKKPAKCAEIWCQGLGPAAMFLIQCFLDIYFLSLPRPSKYHNSSFFNFIFS